jgi:hypothetical protein
MERIPATSAVLVAAEIAATEETPATAGETSNNRDASKSSKAKHQLVGKQKNCDIAAGGVLATAGQHHQGRQQQQGR